MNEPSRAALERELESCRAELAEERAYQAAVSDVLRVISESPSDLQPVFEAITERAAMLCNADFGALVRFDGEVMKVGAIHGFSPESEQAGRALYPMKPRRDIPSGRAIIDRVPVHVADFHTDPDLTALGPVLTAELRSALAVPMLKNGQCLGSLVVMRASPGPFPQELIALFQTFADQAVIAIENVRLFNETQEALEQQTAISEILRVISESPTDVQPVFDAITERAMVLCNADIGFATRFDGEFMHLATVSGLSPKTTDVTSALFPMEPGRNTASGRAVLDRAPVQIPDTVADAEHTLHAAARESRSLLAVPLMREGEVLGAIAVGRTEPGLFPEKLVSLLETFADQAVIAIENVRLFNETQEALEQQTAISEILRVISESPTDVQPVFDTIAERAMVLCMAEIGVATRFDGELIHLAAITGMSRKTADFAKAAFPMEPGRGSLAGRTVLERAPVQIPDMLADPEFTLRTAAQEARSGLSVPLMREGQVIGTLMVARNGTGVFPDKQVSLLKTFADQAVIAIENVRLFNETQDALQRQTAISDILRVTTESPSDSEPVLAAIAEHASRLCDAASASIFLIEGDMLRHVASRGPLADQVSLLEAFPIDRTSTSGRAVIDRRTVQVDDVQAEAEEFPRGHELALRLGHRSVIVAPLLREGTPFGTILLLRQDVRPFRDREVSLLRTFGDQAAIALQSVRGIQETKEALEQQTATAEVLRVISSSVADTAPVFEKILDSCEQLFATDELGILLVDGDEIDIGAYRGEALEAVTSTFPRPLDETASGVAIRERTTVHYPRVRNDAGAPDTLLGIADLIGDFSIAIAPMLWKDEAVGTLLMVRRPPEPFTDKEIALSATFADQAVIAIQNARLFHEIEDKSHELEVANQHKSEFLANMSHELRTPLNAIIGFSEVLIERMFGELNDKQDDYLRDIYSSGKHLLALINDILDLSKIEAGRMELELETFDIKEALANTLTLIRERAQQHGIMLELETAPGLGEIRADQRKLKQIMLNLLSNAVKFTPDGGRIDVSAAFVDDLLRISVSDTGIGIAKSDRETIFQEFRQVGGDYTNKQEGTGLGLALTKRFVELHGGTLSLSSEPGRGSTFTFTLPRQP